MDFVEIPFHLLCTLLALHFTRARFRAGMPLFGQAMVAAAILELVFSLWQMTLAASLCAVAFILLYMKSAAILQAHALDDGSLS